MQDQKTGYTFEFGRGCAAASTSVPMGISFVDPLAQDGPGDEPVLATRRGLARVALVAAETAARFGRQAVSHEPMSWMLAPRRMFDGAAAIDACLGRTECVRALALHACGTEFDADPDLLDELAEGWDEEDADGDGAVASAEQPLPPPTGRAALFSTTAVEENDGELVHLFDAVIADSRAEAEALFALRHGAEVAAGADMIEGFRPDLPLVAALVSPAMGDMLSQVALDPTSPLARGLHVTVEQRFAS